MPAINSLALGILASKPGHGFLLAALLTFVLGGCGKSAPETVYPKPTYVSLRVALTGSAAPEAGVAKIVSATLVASGCLLGGEQKFTVAGERPDHILNLTEGDSGCVLTLTRVTLSDTRGEDVYTPVDSTGIGGSVGAQSLMTGEKTGRKLRVNVGSVLSSPLAHLEQATFSIAPAGEDGPLLYSKVTDFAGDAGQTPKFLPTSFTDLGFDSASGKRQIVVVVECLEPVALAACVGQNLLDTRYRLLTRAERTFTSKQDAAQAIEETSGPVRPTVGHYFGNGVRFTATLTEAGALPDLTFVIAYKDSYRVFEVGATSVTLP